MQRIIEAAHRLRGWRSVEELQRAARLPDSGQFQDEFAVVPLEDKTGRSVDALSSCATRWAFR
jgi:hypothetical protein